jgi:hypothetical protein
MILIIFVLAAVAVVYYLLATGSDFPDDENCDWYD